MFFSKAGLGAVVAAALLATPASALVMPYGGDKLSEMSSVAIDGNGGKATKQKKFGPKAKRNAKKRKGAKGGLNRFGILVREMEGFRKKRKKKRAYVPDDPAPTSPTVTPVVPTPIPASGLLLLGGLAAVGMASRRRKASS